MASDYKVLYRKYRPSSFDEVIGQKYTIRMLKNAVINNKISHAYLFTGPRGTGKTSSAKIFAKTINCEKLKDGIPCGTCQSCLNIEHNADIIEIDAASNTGVDEIRELINNVKIAPSFSKYKVYIIDEVHMLTKNAFNALLLTLEEPPNHVVFILATTDIENVPITILSRCQRYDFKKIEEDDLYFHLKMVCEQEKIVITEDAIREIVYLSEGGCRDALSILNQLATSNDSIDLNTVINNYGSISLVQIKEIVSNFLENDINKMSIVFEKMEKVSVDYKIFIKKMVDQFFLQAIDYKKRYEDLVFEKIKNVVFELNDVINKINITIDPFLLIYMVLLKYMDVETVQIVEPIENSTKFVEFEKKSESFIGEKTKVTDKFSTKEPIDEKKETYLQTLKKVRINNCFAEADKNLLNSCKEKWSLFNEKVAMSDILKPAIIDASVVLASSKINILMQTQESMVEIFNQEVKQVEAKYKEIFLEKMVFISLSKEEWEIAKKEYIKNIKEKYVYQLIEEPTFVVEDKTEVADGSVKNDLEEIFQIFDKNKLEII